MRRTTEVFVVAVWALVGCGSEAPVTPSLDSGVARQCSSATYWTRGETSSAVMLPGRPCLGCHAESVVAPFSVGGTVYPTAHEPDDCNGLDGYTRPALRVEITDALGTIVTLPVNGAGNFYHRLALVPPYRARLLDGDRVRTMLAPQTSGDCNGCHSTDGAAGAPGRITPP